MNVLNRRRSCNIVDEAGRPVVRDGQRVMRPVMTISVTFDHRVLDSVTVTRFYNKIIELINNPDFLHFQYISRAFGII
ncbi:MAG: hypothetical protein E3J37_03545 [Anaerolineales bacterium]|nr:MAG: hypothetical protein E3J37_03545 [Anaerolineales bacterium]